MSLTAVMIHGFAGSSRSWDAVATEISDRSELALARIDLPGHGEAVDIDPAGYAQAAEMALSAAPGELVLCGYSLGARVALAAALARPARVAGLVMLSGHAGIDDAEARARRRSADERLAARIEAMDAEQFADLWNGQAVFEADSPEVHRQARAELVEAVPARLAAALRSLGPGAFEPAWGLLADLRMPMLAVAGEDDGDYPLHAQRLARLARGRSVILPGGHRQHLENPGRLAAELEALCSEAG